MSISIHHSHDKPHDLARKLAEDVAAEMQQEFSMNHHWEGDVMHFQRPGVTGQLTLAPGEVIMEVKLGFLLMALKPKIESEARKFLDQHFG